ncbi:hypothetical protein [Rhodohalobacter sulfatireducens]|uniref:DUF1772 domain-containing protein n=1 Tax=Rhodohalobacter sulfatireducens TaxID=2911366 RepID=A0ABS9KES8_9BACT|nr:hypothetical protein [Rhodohalobacter sulfatireducens]MCG2589367.1 hypothetical protein [Rhodohalobacter sulfatireducens]
MLSLALIANIFCSFALFGLIWCVQLVHYPFFLRADKINFIDHIDFHKLRISIVVVPLMTIELATSGILAFTSAQFAGWNMFGFAVVTLIWLVTFFVQVPLHNQLSDGYDESTVQKLIKTNWIRTALWSAKSFSSLVLLFFLV